jgi:hypothetical protein
MKKLLTVVAVAEMATGAALIVVPSLVGRLLLGAEFFGVAVVVGRVAGIALFALGIACWLGRDDTQSRASRGLVAAMLLYNVGTVAVLAFAGVGLGLHGMLLWPAVVLHAVMAVWCIVCLRSSINAMD